MMFFHIGEPMRISVSCTSGALMSPAMGRKRQTVMAVTVRSDEPCDDRTVDVPSLKLNRPGAPEAVLFFGAAVGMHGQAGLMPLSVSRSV